MSKTNKKTPPYFVKASSLIYVWSSLNPNELHTEVTISISQRNKIIIRTLNTESLVTCSASARQLNPAKRQQTDHSHASLRACTQQAQRSESREICSLSGSKRKAGKYLQNATSQALGQGWYSFESYQRSAGPPNF